MNGRTRFPLSLPGTSETTARGTGLGAQRGKKTLLSLTLAGSGRARGAGRKAGGRAGERPLATRSPHEFHSEESFVVEKEDKKREKKLAVGSLAGAARLQESNAAVQRQAQRGGKPREEHKGKSLPEQPRTGGGAGKPGPSDPAPARWQRRGWRKSYHRDNWLVAAKRPQRRRFLILRCRLFLALRCTRRKAWDCSPTKRERELGLDRRETG
ncbi:hypothetical protein ENBRE01_2173 [Enteropsectra breve]|nr:hypothetical protein ENBRE01_2173 [Enteropsectra breve]